MGIGFAAIRDIVAFLRHATHDEAGNANPLAPAAKPCIRHALGFGISQSGRVLRDLLYYGFNQDLAGRKVFDAMLPVVGGSRRTCVNCRVRAARPLFPAARGPFLRRRPVPVQLSDADRSDQRPHGRHPAKRTRCRRVPEGDASGYRERCLAGAQFAGGHRHRRRRYRHAGGRARLSRKWRAARRASADGEAGDAVAGQSARLWRVHAVAADCAGRMGGAWRCAAGQPLPIARRRNVCVAG